MKMRFRLPEQVRSGRAACAAHLCAGMPARRRLAGHLAAALASLLLFSLNAHGAQVVAVHSGDTLSITENGRTFKIRLAKVDAPELDQPYGPEAKKSLKDLCEGKKASYQREGEPVKGEMQAVVLCNGTDAGRAQLKRGLAWVRPHGEQDPAFTFIQDFVWRDKIGLWADADPVPPWEWAERKK